MNNETTNNAAETTSKTYAVRFENVTGLEALVEKLNKRAARLGVLPITLTKGAPKVEKRYRAPAPGEAVMLSRTQGYKGGPVL